MITVGPPGAGKSTMATRFTDGFPCPVAYLSLEEGAGPTLGERLTRLGVKRADFHVFSGGHLDDLVAELLELKVKVLAVDSISVAQLVPEELRRLQRAAKLDVVVATQQVTKEGIGAGSNAWAHEADLVLRVEDMSWAVVKSRFEPTGGKGDVLWSDRDTAACTV